jgi:hypothetical protein
MLFRVVYVVLLRSLRVDFAMAGLQYGFSTCELSLYKNTNIIMKMTIILYISSSIMEQPGNKISICHIY